MHETCACLSSADIYVLTVSGAWLLDIPDLCLSYSSGKDSCGALCLEQADQLLVDLSLCSQCGLDGPSDNHDRQAHYIPGRLCAGRLSQAVYCYDGQSKEAPLKDCYVMCRR